nr:type IV secretion system protein TraC [Azomonas macrocytogenes]
MRASGIIPVVAYSPEHEFFLMDDKSMGFGFLCEPLNAGDEKIQDRVNGFLNQEFPTGTNIQFLLFRSPDITQQMHNMLGLRDNFQHPLMSSVIKERQRFLLDHACNPVVTDSRSGHFNLGIVQDTKLLITVKCPITGQQPSPYEIDELKQLNIKVRSSLQTIGLQPTLLNADRYVRLMSTLLNWEKDASWRHDAAQWDPFTPICSQLFDYGTDLEVNKDSVRLGEQYVKVLSAKKLPNKAFFGDAIRYVGDLSGGDSSVRENYMVVVNLYYPETEATKSALDRNRQFVVNQAYGPLLKFVPELADKHESFDDLYASIKEGFKPIKLSYALVIFAPTAERAQSAAMSARNLWREARFEIMEDKYIMLPSLINNLPLCTDIKAQKDLFRHKTMTVQQAAVLAPLFGEWKGTGTFHASLLSRNGQLMSLSLHDSNTNKNLVIAAESGSGKSFLVNELIMSYLSEGAHVWVIDVGRSYEKLCALLEGDFVHFEEGSNVNLNPFELIENYDDEEDAMVSLVMAMASVGGNLTELQVSALKQMMAKVWSEQGQGMKVDHIAEICLASEDQRLKDIGQQLYAFTSQGSYGRYFSQRNNVSFQNRFTVLELDELQGRKHLRQVVLLQLIYQIQQEVYLGNRNRKKIVIIDEAWDLLKEGEVSVFMEHAYRKFRKYGGSVVIATQSINDLYENPVGRAIAENSANMYLLGQTAETVESIKRTGRLTLAEGGYKMLKSVHTILGVYSEIFVKSNAGVGIGRLVVGDFQKLLYSTDPRDVAAINQYVKQGLEVTDAIYAVLRDRQESQHG